jgi:DNA-3-methyladenine glycosylase
MDRSFFERDTLEVAADLIGCCFVRYLPNRELPIIVQINETEAYKGADDPASHAYRGITKRNQMMFGPAGQLYVYFTYGMHFCMNIVTEKEGVAGAVLLRGASILQGIDAVRELRKATPMMKDQHLLNGPAKLTQGLKIDANWNGYDLFNHDDSSPSPLMLVPLSAHEPQRIWTRTKRIGISKAQEFLWRFVSQ